MQKQVHSMCANTRGRLVQLPQEAGGERGRGGGRGGRLLGRGGRRGRAGGKSPVLGCTCLGPWWESSAREAQASGALRALPLPASWHPPARGGARSMAGAAPPAPPCWGRDSKRILGDTVVVGALASFGQLGTLGSSVSRDGAS